MILTESELQEVIDLVATMNDTVGSGNTIVFGGAFKLYDSNGDEVGELAYDVDHNWHFRYAE